MPAVHRHCSSRLVFGTVVTLTAAWVLAGCGGGGATYFPVGDASAGAGGLGGSSTGAGGSSAGAGGSAGSGACRSDDECAEPTPCSTHAECPESRHCLSGSCVLDVCQAGLASCDGNSVALCDAEGTGFTALVPCGAGTVCVATESGAASCEADGSGGGSGAGGTASDGGGSGTAGSSGDAGSGGIAGTGGSGGASGTGGNAGAGGSGGGVQGPVTKIFGEVPGTDHAGVTIDTKIRGDNATTQTYDYGGGWFMGPDASPIIHALLRFDLSAIPVGSEVLSAVLELWTGACANCQGNPGTSIEVFRLLEAWVEGSADSEVTPTLGYCNWNYRNSTTAWSSPGAEPPSRGSTPVATFSPLALDTKYSLNLTNLVQDWVSAPSGNHGVLFKMVDPQYTDGVAFVSSENNENASSPGKRPRLIVQYQP